MSLEDQNQSADPGANTQAPGGAPQGGGDQGGKPADQQQQDRRTLGEGGGGEPKEGAVPPPAWREDWRDAMAGGDADFRKVLNRFQSPEGVAKSFREANAKIRSGQVREPLPEKPSDEQLAAWRKDNGIPEKPEGYTIDPGNGLVFSEDDKPMLDGFAKYAHERNWTPEQVNQAAGFVAQLGEQNKAAQDARDKEYQANAATALREEWGRDFNANLQNFSNMVGRYGSPELHGYLMSSRGPDGARFGDNADFLRMMTTLARELNPIDTVVPAGTPNAGKAVDEELRALTEMQRNEPDKYEKEDGGRHRLRKLELLRAKEKQQSRG